MKQLYISILTLLAVSFPGFAAAHRLAKSSNLPRPDDKIAIERYEILSPGNGGKGVVWDFSEANVISGTDYLEIIDIGNNSFGQKANRVRMDYRVSGDTVLWTGFERRLSEIHEVVPAVKMVFPVCFGDTCVSSFRMKGKYAVSANTECAGTAKTVADGQGVLIMPGNDTICDVLRLRSDYNISRGGLLRFHQEHLGQYAGSGLITTYEWYAPGYRYPVMTVTEVWADTDGTPILVDREAHCCTRVSQEYAVKSDDENEKIRNANTKADDTDEANPHHPISKAEVIRNGNNYILEFNSSVTGGWAECVLSDINGIVRYVLPRHAVTQGDNTVEIDCSGLESGEYALMLIYGEQNVRMKLTVR